MRLKQGNKTYLDHLTMTPVHDQVLEAFLENLDQDYGSARSSNLPGRRAQEFLEKASEETASFFGGRRAFFYPDGGMAAGLSLTSLSRAARENGRDRVLAARTETPSVLAALRMLSAEGSCVELLPCSSEGRIVPPVLLDAMNDRVGVVSVSWASGISGIVQPVEELAGIAHEGGAYFHSSASAVAGRIELDISASDVDVITVDSQRLGGIPGTGAVISNLDDLWLMNRCSEIPEMTGIPGIASLLAALRVISTGISPRARLVAQLRAELLAGLERLSIQYSVIGGSLDNLLPGAALLRMRRIYPGFHAKMEDNDVILPSHLCSERLGYLRNLGIEVSEEDQERFVGFSLAPMNTILEVEHFLRAVSVSIRPRSGRR